MSINNAVAKFVILFIIVIFTAAAHAAPVTAQIKPKPKPKRVPANRLVVSISSETYHEVLDLLMPQLIVLDGLSEAALAVRIQPSFEGEESLVFVKQKNGAVKITRVGALKNIFYHMIAIEQKTPDKSAAEFVKLIPIKKSETVISPQKFDRLTSEFMIALREHQEKQAARKDDLTITADGTEYQFRFLNDQQTGAIVRGGSVSFPPPKEGEDPLIAWTRKVRQELGAL